MGIFRRAYAAILVLALIGFCFAFYTNTITIPQFLQNDSLRGITIAKWTDPASETRHHNTSKSPKTEFHEDTVSLPALKDHPNLERQWPSRDEGQEESSLLPLRGIGDSQLPFQDKYAPQIDRYPKDLFTEKPKGVDPSNPDNPPLKKILFWNDAYSAKHFGLGFGREPFLRAKCPVNTCTATGERNRFPLKDIDAVLWHFRAKDRSLPAVRSPHTRYVFWNMESASYLYGNLGRYNNVFNWTFTYRLDSDLPNTYGNVYRRRDSLPMPDFRNMTSGKTKLAAWFVSNCHTVSGRETFVTALRRSMKIDQYGKCGQLKCDRKVQWETCYTMLEKDYKFYLSFENSLCKDYATEKFFNILKFNVVPVVYGFGNYSVLAPPHSYINALDFPSPEDLAKYLLYLDKNDTAYHEYFLWKPYHHFPSNWDKRMKPFCQLCERLHTDHKKKTYDMQRWYVKDAHCQNSFSSGRKYLNNRGT